MKDLLTDQFRERFTGLEMDVPPSVWEHVSGQLATDASSESLRNALQEKFSGHEMEVSPSAWAGISAQLGHGAAAGTGLSAGWIAAGVAALAIGAGALLWNQNPMEKTIIREQEPIVTEVATPAANSSTIVAETLPVAPAPVSPQRIKASVPPVAHRVSAAPPPAETKAHSHTETTSPVASISAQVSSATTESTPPTEPVATAQPVSTPARPQPGNMNTTAAPPEKSTTPEEAKTASTTTQPENSDPFHTDDREHIFIPNAFSPNGDAVNDAFEISLRDYNKADVRVFSASSGALVFQTSDLTKKWDGRLPNGNFAEEGNYQCVVNWTDREGRPHSANVTVRLFR